MRVGLTGGIGSGKSTVAAMLAERGAVIIDADAVAREVVEPGSEALREIADAFGPEVIGVDGRLDRARLAGIVFSDAAALARLNAITHPRIAARSAELLDAAPLTAVVVYDMPLLVENGLTQGWDAVVVVDAPEDQRVERLVEKGLDSEDARRRIMAQASRQERLAAADYVIDNSRDIVDLTGQVDDLWARLVGTRPGP